MLGGVLWEILTKYQAQITGLVNSSPVIINITYTSCYAIPKQNNFLLKRLDYTCTVSAFTYK